MGQSGSDVPSAFYFGTANNNPIYVYTGNMKRWTFAGSGHFAATDNTLDVGAVGATVENRHWYVAGGADRECDCQAQVTAQTE
jgi:hypothetical protein